jgi:hypothetical protein
MEHGIAGVGRRRWLTVVRRDCSGGLAAVLTEKKKRGEMRARERIKEVEEGSWTCYGTKKRHG